MPFCPSCKAEYKSGVVECPTCNERLVAELAGGLSDDMVEVFSCFEQQLAERVVEVLEGGGVEPLLRQQSSSILPTNVGMTGELRVAVPERFADKARELLRAADEDGVLGGDSGQQGESEPA